MGKRLAHVPFGHSKRGMQADVTKVDSSLCTDHIVDTRQKAEAGQSLPCGGLHSPWTGEGPRDGQKCGLGDKDSEGSRRSRQAHTPTSEVGCLALFGSEAGASGLGQPRQDGPPEGKM